MRLTARWRTTRTALAGLASGLVLVGSLTGCMTVQGAEAVVPAISEDDAAEVLAEYLEVKNAANPEYDAELTLTIETGTMGAINSSGQRARSEVHPDGNQNYTPMEFSDSRYLIPRQAGWPKFFVADTQTNRGDARWLLVFTRNGVNEDWLASYLSVMPPEEIPEFATDDDGYVEAVSASDGDGLAMSPAELAEAYAEYLQTGEGEFAEGTHTSGERAKRQEADQNPVVVVQRQDWAAEEAASQAVGLRTGDGGALVFFSTHHHDKQNWAEGETPVVEQYVEALMEGTATRAVTTRAMGMQSAQLPTDSAPVTIRARITGVLGATGE